MRLAHFFMVGAFGCLAISVCHAATVTSLSGSVQVNTGAGFAPVVSTQSVPTMAKVMVSSGGSALVTYSAKCAVRLPSGIWSVQAKSPCAEGVALLDFTSRMGQQAPPATQTGPSTETLVVGGLIVGGAVAAAIVLSQDDDDTPASP